MIHAESFRVGSALDSGYTDGLFEDAPPLVWQALYVPLEKLHAALRSLVRDNIVLMPAPPRIEILFAGPARILCLAPPLHSVTDTSRAA